MQAVDRAIWLVRNGRVADAYALLLAASAGGDGAAALELAHWRMAGDLIRRDLGEARRLFGLAADRGVALAEPAYLALLANGAGGVERRWRDALTRLQRSTDPQARQQAALIAAMDLDPDGNPTRTWPVEHVSTAPLIRAIAGFLTPAECACLAALASPALQPSQVIDPATGRLILDPVRRSSSTAFPFVLESPFIHALNQRIAAVTGTNWEQGEPMQVLSYRPGQEYRRHSDAIRGEANQRTLTLLVLLSDDFDGGETHFTEIDRAFRGRVGDALLFGNADAQGNPDPLAFHAGKPVTRGQKLILSKWIRRYPLDLTGPPGRPF